MNTQNKFEMNRQIEIERKEWLRGTLSSWVVVAMIGIIGWGAKQSFEDFKSTMAKAIDQIMAHEVRISVLENATGIRADDQKTEDVHLGKN